MEKQQLIERILSESLDTDKEWSWFQDKLKSITTDFSPKNFYLAFSSTHRFIGKKTLQLNDATRTQLEQYYPGFNPDTWRADQLCRTAFMLALPVEENKTLLENLFTTADINELLALYKSLFFLENAADFELRAAEGIRTNITDVFDAVALDNPFPARYLKDEAWNQIVLKAIFMERPIYRIIGLEERRNKDLAFILHDYAHERWSAGRTVSPELWRMMTGFVDETLFEDLRKVIHSDTELAKEAAIKVIRESDFQTAKDWLLKEHSESPSKSWEEIGLLLHQN